MSFSELETFSSLRPVLRVAPPLALEESIGRAVRLMRDCGLHSLPVVQYGHLAGMVTDAALREYIAGNSVSISYAPEARLLRPVREVMSSPELLVSAESTPADLRALCERHGVGLLDAVPVVANGGYLLGLITYSDLLAPRLSRPPLATVGGMATPFGVYLTDGSIQAGVGNGALVASGVVLGLMLYAARFLVSEGIGLAQRVALLPHARWLDMDYAPPANQVGAGLASVAVNALYLVPFFLLMRFSPLAGFHAAEHQTVHALERDEPLEPDVVQRMPRPHPRCGTNLMAALLLFFTLRDGLYYVNALSDGADIIALIVTLSFWRRLGTFLQARCTTRTASAREIASGIAAAHDLMAKTRTQRPSRPNVLRRLWCQGLVQNMIGASLAGGLIWGVQYAFDLLHH